MTKITAKEAEKLLRRARDEKGADYRDPNATKDNATCAYFKRSGEPGCIVGHVLAYADKRPFSPRSADNKDGIYGLARKYPELFTARAVDVLAVAQDVQDDGGTWGEAVARVNRKFH